MPRPKRSNNDAIPAAKEKQKKRGGGAGKPDDDDPQKRRRRSLMQYSYDDTDEDMTSSDSYESSQGPITRSKAASAPIKIPKRQKQQATKMIDEEESASSSEDEDEDEDYGTVIPSGTSFQINIGSFDESSDPMIPKRHDLNKEPAIVKKFVDLVTKPIEEVGIDAQIDQFKAMDHVKQQELLDALERRPTPTDSGAQMMFRILTMKMSPELKAMALAKYQALQCMDTGSSEYYKQRSWLDKFCSMPFGDYKDFPVILDRDGPEACSAFLAKAKGGLDGAVFGQEETKLQILQFIANKIANPTARGKSLLLIGPPGVGKTQLIKNGIAAALEWPFQIISLGGDSDASTYTGHQLVYESSHPGKIVTSLITSKSMSTILMFDEVDKISATPKGEEVQNLLVHLTDPVQNEGFEDKYLAGVPIDLSHVMFIFSANDISKIDKILLDRMNVIHLKGYTNREKLTIAENYLLPAALKEVALSERVSVPRDVMEHIINVFAADQKGVRELKRCIETIVQKINMLRMYNNPSLPFYVKDFSLPFIVRREHVEIFLKKKNDGRDDFPHFMYT
jgi:ATP-dependent Lon protease